MPRSPLFEHAVITPAGISRSARIVIDAPDAADATYVTGLRVDRQSRQESWVSSDVLCDGAYLAYELSEESSTE